MTGTATRGDGATLHGGTRHGGYKDVVEPHTDHAHVRTDAFANGAC